jgi:hypothetical protein
MPRYLGNNLTWTIRYLFVVSSLAPISRIVIFLKPVTESLPIRRS